MKILAIDSSGMTASVAVVQDDKLLAEYTVNNKMTHSQTLLPMIDEVIKRTNTDMKELDAIAVSAGPGSFTGLRIGSATAKGLAMALNKNIISVPTLDAMAYNFNEYSQVICPLMDARRNRAYAGIYEFVNGELKILCEQTVDEVENIVAMINDIGRPVIFLGDGSVVYKEMLNEKVLVEHSFAPFHMREQSAASVAALAVKMFEQGKIESSDEHKPIYLRPSQAETEKMKKEAEKEQ